LHELHNLVDVSSIFFPKQRIFFQSIAHDIPKGNFKKSLKCRPKVCLKTSELVKDVSSVQWKMKLEMC